MQRHRDETEIRLIKSKTGMALKAAGLTEAAKNGKNVLLK